MARPTKFTESTVKKLLDAIRIGGSYESACRYAGITYSTFDMWRDGAFPRKTDPALKIEFFEGLTRAMGEADTSDLAAVRSAAKSGDWRAAAWGLERRHPAEYGKREAVDVTHRINLTIMAEQIAAEHGMSAAEVLAEAERIVAIGAQT